MVFALFAVQLAFMKKIGAGDVQCISYGVICCNSEKVQPPSLPDFPPSFQQLYTSPEAHCIFFCNHIRKFNASFCMALMNVRDVSLPLLASFQIHGQLFWNIGPIWNNSTEPPWCIQTYFYKHEEQVSLWSSFYHGLLNDHDNNLFKELCCNIHSELLHCHNHL